MIKDIEIKIQETTMEALRLAKRMQEVTSEGFLVLVSMPKRLNKATVTIFGMRRPWPVRQKFQVLHKTIRGHWDFEHTTQKFTKLTSTIHNNPVKLVIYLYTERCLDPKSFEDVEILRGTRGRVLTPERCNGFETPLLRGMGVDDKRASESANKNAQQKEA